MRIAVLMAIVVVGFVLGLLYWRAGRAESFSLDVVQESPENIAKPTEPAIIQQPEIAPDSGSLSATPTRAAALLPDGKPKVQRTARVVTLLRIQVLAKEDMSPLTDKLLALHDKGALDPSGGRFIRAPRGRVGGSRSTDESGWAEMEVDPDCEYSIRIVGLEWDTEEHLVGPLAAGERREIQLLVATREAGEDDLVFFGLLLDAENSMPVVRGTLQVEGQVSTTYTDSSGTSLGVNREGPPIRADIDGRFKILDKSLRSRTVAVTAPGYARAMFALDARHSDSQKPLEVRMWRSASVDAIVSDASGAPIVDATVELTNEAGYLSREFFSSQYDCILDPHWSARTDASGMARVIDLPPGVPLKLIVNRQGFASRMETEPLVLSAGERRRIEIPWGTGGIVRGRLLDGAGGPVAGHRIWRMMCETPTPVPVVFKDNGKPAAATRTDEQGRFQFADVPLGVWYVGIAPELELLRETSGFPAYAEPIEVRAEGEVIELVLSVEAGLYLRGTVIDQRGDPVAWCAIQGSLENTSISEIGQTERSGEFEFGPLPKGVWILEARELEGENTPPPQARVQAGTDGIVIRLRTGASIEGTVVDGATFAPVESFLTIARTDGASVRRSTSVSDEGGFKFAGLLPGTYVICARDHAGAIGISEAISIAEGQALRGVEIGLVPGAQLRLRYEGRSQYAHCAIHAGGLPIAARTLEKGGSPQLPVPAGSIELRWTDSETKVTKSQVLTLGAGEVREVVWDGTP